MPRPALCHKQFEMHPYRTAPPPRPVDHRRPLEEWLIAGGLLALGALRVVIAIATGEAFGTEATIAALVAAAGAVLLVRAL